MQPIRLPEHARFTCQSCGRCCQGWAVPVDQATVDRLRAHDWGEDPFESAPGAGEPYRTRLVAGRCFFLDRENRCRIHNEMSYEAKPPVCRSFPLTVLEVGGTRHARLSFWCPTVSANSGKPLEHQASWLKETARHSDRRSMPLTINQTTEISLRDFERIHLMLRRFLVDATLPTAERLAAGAGLIRRLDESAGKESTPPLAEVVQTAEAEGAAVLASEARRGGRPGGGRRVLSLYLLQDRQGGRLSILARLLSVVLFNTGAIRLRSSAVPGAASWRQIRGVSFSASGASTELLTRYFTSKLDSRRYVAGDATLVDGFNLLLAAYGMINVLARMRAASDGRSSTDEEDIRQAVSAADLLVVEHPGIYHGRLHARLVKAALGGTDVCGDLLARLD
jgi:lysine-N-methylase